MKYTFVNQIVPGLPKNQYYYGKPSSIVAHDTGNDSSTIDGEISYMSRSWGNAFVHAWANADKVVETANTDYPCWGAGPGINSFAVQIELVHEHTKERFLKSIDRWIFWMAYQAYWYDIVPNDATQDGDGTIWTHEAVSKYLGYTDHVDPMPYIRSRGADFGLNITWQMIYNKIVEYYQALLKGDSTNVKALGETSKYEAVQTSLNLSKQNEKKVLKPGTKIGPWTVDSKGNKYRGEKAKFTVTVDDGIQCYYSGPSLKNGKASVLKKGNAVNYDTVYLADGYVWIKWKADDGKNVYAPISKVNSSGNPVKLWGKIKK